MTVTLRNRLLRLGCAVLLGLAILSGLALRADDKKPDHSAVKPDERKDRAAVDRHQEFLKKADKDKIEVLFLGDSLTQGWEGGGKEVWKKHLEGLKAANFGIGGDRTQHLLWRITEGKELKDLKPKVVVLLIGTNNLNANGSDEIADGVNAIVKELNQQLPQAKVLLLGLFPRAVKKTDPFPIKGKDKDKDKDKEPKEKDPLREKVKEVNERLAKLYDDKSNKNVRYLDIGAKFLDKDGELSDRNMPNNVNLSPTGYQVWADAMLPTLKELLKE